MKKGTPIPKESFDLFSIGGLYSPKQRYDQYKKISVGSVPPEAELNDSPTARKIVSILPFEGGFHSWEDEIYFEIPVNDKLESDAKEAASHHHQQPPGSGDHRIKKIAF